MNGNTTRLVIFTCLLLLVGAALAGDRTYSLDPGSDQLSDHGAHIDVGNENWTWGQVRAAYR